MSKTHKKMKSYFLRSTKFELSLTDLKNTIFINIILKALQKKAKFVVVKIFLLKITHVGVLSLRKSLTQMCTPLLPQTPLLT